MRRRQGFALILALLLVATAAVVALAVAGRARDVAMDDARDRACGVARAAARGGVERARWALSRDASYGGETVRIGRSDVEIRIEHRDGRTTVVAVARTPSAPFTETVTRRVDADVLPGDPGLPAISAWRE